MKFKALSEILRLVNWQTAGKLVMPQDGRLYYVNMS